MQKMPRSSRSRYATQPIYRSSMQKPVARPGLPFGGFVNVSRNLGPLPPFVAPVGRAKGTNGLLSTHSDAEAAASHGSAYSDRPDGHAVVVDAKADDLHTQPSGDAVASIASGVFTGT